VTKSFDPAKSGCPLPPRDQCNAADANTCCGGGSDEPCHCTTCHPTVIALPYAEEWFDDNVEIGSFADTLGFGRAVRDATIRVLDGYRKTVKKEIARSEHERNT
jgi:hypothetical protein